MGLYGGIPKNKKTHQTNMEGKKRSFFLRFCLAPPAVLNIPDVSINRIYILNPRTRGVGHAAEASGHVFLKNKVLTNKQWMYIFSESLLSSLELSLWPYMKIVRSRRASKLRRATTRLDLYYSFDILHGRTHRAVDTAVDTATELLILHNPPS